MESSKICQVDYGAFLLSFFGEQQEADFYFWLKSRPLAKGDLLWLGMTDQNDAAEFRWTSTNAPPSYQNWAFGEPGRDDFVGSRCVTSGPVGETTAWAARRCAEKTREAYPNRVCMKQVGKNCPTGWTFHGSGNGGGKCYRYFVAGGVHTSWYSQRDYCQSIGARSLRIESEAEQEIISHYFDQWARGGTTRVWLDLSGTGFKVLGLHRLNYPIKIQISKPF